MSVLLDARPHSAAIKSAVDASLQSSGYDWEAYDYGKVPGADGNKGSLPHIYVLMTVERRPNPVTRTPGRAGSAGWRVTLRSVGRTVKECQWAQERVADALNEKRLLVKGKFTNRLQYEPGQAPEQDNGRVSALDLYIYRH